MGTIAGWYGVYIGNAAIPMAIFMSRLLADDFMQTMADAYPNLVLKRVAIRITGVMDA